MDFCNDGDLYERIQRYKRERLSFTEDEVWRVLCQTVAGLHSLHSLQVMHRDIKSANLFLTKPTNS